MAAGLFGDLSRTLKNPALARAMGLGGLFAPSGRTPPFNPDPNQQGPGLPGALPGTFPGGSPTLPGGSPPPTPTQPPVRPEDPPLIKIGKWASPSARELTSNPLFTVGLGLLSAGWDGSNPYQAAMQGLQQAQVNKNQFQAQDDAETARQRAEQEWQWKTEDRGDVEKQRQNDEELRKVFAQQNLTPDQALQAAMQYGSRELQQEIIKEMAGGLLGSKGLDPTSQQKNYETLMQIRATYGMNSPQEQAFMSVFRQDPTMTADSRKFIFEAFAGANEFRTQGAQALDLANRLEQAAARLPNGLASTVDEYAKELFGSQDEYSIIRRDVAKQINAGVLQALPPGPATDKDIIEAKKGFPPANAKAETLASYFRGVAKIQERKAAFEEFKGRYAATNVRLDGLWDAWYQEYERLFPGETARGAQAPNAAVIDIDPSQLPPAPGGKP